MKQMRKFTKLALIIAFVAVMIVFMLTVRLIYTNIQKGMLNKSKVVLIGLDGSYLKVNAAIDKSRQVS